MIDASDKRRMVIELRGIAATFDEVARHLKRGDPERAGRELDSVDNHFRRLANAVELL